MKKIIIFLLAFGLITIINRSCKKEEKKIAKNWNLIKYEENGLQIPISGSVVLNFSSGGTYNTNASFLPTGGGTWSLAQDGAELILISAGGDTHTFLIERLYKNELRLSEPYGPTPGADWSESYWEP